MKNIFILFSVLFFVIFFAGNAKAQDFNPSILLDNSITVEFNPVAPKANSQVNAVASSYNIDLNSANISWFVGGKKQVSGIGLTSFSFFSGDIGKTTTISMIVTTKDGQNIQKTFNIMPAEVDLIWETDGYTPPFYQGKSLFSHEGKLKFVAIPHILSANGKEIPASQLSYKWTKNGTVLGDFSGYGKNTYIMLGSIISIPIDMQVEVTNTSGDIIAKAETTVTPTDPKIVFYKRDPLYGIQLQNSIKTNEIMTDKEIDVLAEPLYFSTNDVSLGNLQYNWKINNQDISNNALKNERIFRSTSNISGTSNIFLSINNISKILQTADESFSLKFNSNNQ
jgi:hypothetical protein